MSKFINKSKLNGNFSILPNDIVNSENLSLKSKGLLWYLLSKPEDWQVNVADIENNSIDGKASVKAGIIELENNGYIVKEKHRKKNGNFDGWDYFVYDSPKAEKPTSVNRTQLSTNIILSTKSISKDIHKNSSYKDINRLKEYLMVNYPVKLEDINDRFRLNSLKMVSSRTQKNYQWLKEDFMENLKDFMSEYTNGVDPKYLAKSVKTLKDKVSSWREYGEKKTESGGSWVSSAPGIEFVN